MINEGIKSKPLDRYPYMENDLKNYKSEIEKLKPIPIKGARWEDFFAVINERIRLMRYFWSMKQGNIYYLSFGFDFPNNEILTVGEKFKIGTLKEKYKPYVRGVLSAREGFGTVAKNGDVDLYVQAEPWEYPGSKYYHVTISFITENYVDD